MKNNAREFTRTSFVSTILYSAPVMDMRKLRKIHARAVSIDISIGGMGMVAEYPLEKGHVLVFDDEVRSEWIVARTAVVQWALQIPDEKYRVGLKFV